MNGTINEVRQEASERNEEWRSAGAKQNISVLTSKAEVNDLRGGGKKKLVEGYRMLPWKRKTPEKVYGCGERQHGRWKMEDGRFARRRDELSWRCCECFGRCLFCFFFSFIVYVCVSFTSRCQRPVMLGPSHLHHSYHHPWSLRGQSLWFWSLRMQYHPPTRCFLI